MKKILIITMLLIFSTTNVVAAENNGVQEVKTGIQALFTMDNDGDGINDRADLCKDTPITPTHTDNDLDGCDDNMSMLLESTSTSTDDINTDEVDSNKKEEDSDSDGLIDNEDACIYFAPTIDENENGCEDNQIRTTYVASQVYENSFSITGVAFVDGQEFSNPNMYTTEVEFHNLTTGEYIPGKVATNYCDSSLNESITGAGQDISCSVFTVAFSEEDFAKTCEEDSECLDNQKNNDEKYSVDITLTDSEGQKFTETLYSANDFNGNNSGVVRIGAEEYRVYLTIK